MITLLTDAIPSDFINKVRDRCSEQLLLDNKTKFKRANNRIGNTVNITDTTTLKDLDEEIVIFMRSFIDEFIRYTYRPVFGVSDTGYEFHRYEPGDMCLVHSDQDIIFTNPNENAALIRFATVIMHLNTVDTGGETIFPSQNKTFKSVAGQILIFPPTGSYPHYVTPSEETRDILMTWLVYDSIRAVRI